MARAMKARLYLQGELVAVTDLIHGGLMPENKVEELAVEGAVCAVIFVPDGDEPLPNPSTIGISGPLVRRQGSTPVPPPTPPHSSLGIDAQIRSTISLGRELQSALDELAKTRFLDHDTGGFAGDVVRENKRDALAKVARIAAALRTEALS